ncbi:thiolase family protein [Sulfolobus acidocaldarius]|uniref:Conserved acetyl-CoA acetyltransferase n=4 Tax=Sulfolobus acidocaldarius TaxID=2285 RepID=Q4J7G0_SULAC|nr:thiolase family protein [Sulfolobus acidocaldarius]AAY81271.1 conserved acetyl-CoA acetyltransferase [Sulfolobus acidocaldarius DSM 639]AGE71901.1 acetyl-CoA acetyltransferase [Sulfolobus acidocaldarius N8]AGE74174.1 acetyl-CoA acetyltransferase [Sulfolobus acidocaldarius Ron12/I]ALU30622.1 acetyl-CoA acetyltransferase [Sulfolobus acidocaldarius]ALU32883.1 acetyl-CoA acetyltransferase [Sulfolobus acidocaldarius]
MIVGFSSSIHKKYEGSTFQLLAETVSKALDMATVDLKDIDGLFYTVLPGVFDGKASLHFSSFQIPSFLGIRPKVIELVEYGGPSALTMVYRAEKLIEAGEIDTALCVVGGKASFLRENKVTVDAVDRFLGSVQLTPYDDLFRVYQDLNPVSDYALVAKRHSKLFGTSDEQRALIAVMQRKNALGNERAMYRTPLTVKDVLESRVVSDPLRLLEIVYPVDGFHVFVVSKHQRKSDVRPLKVEFYGESHWSEMPPELPDIVYTPAVESSKGVNLERIDAFQLYDSFTITVMLQMEDIGLTKKGKGGEFVERTDITYQGEVPVNTGGGSLNVGQPAFMSGGVILEEAILQLNNMATNHQVKDVNRVLINGIGGWNRGHSVTMVLGEGNV